MIRRILLATEACLDHGGITVFMLQWIRGIRAIDKNCHIHVYFRDSIEAPDLAEQYKKLHVHIHTGGIKGAVSFKNPYVREKVKKDICRILKRGQINIIHINSGIFGFQLLLLKEAARLGVSTRIAHSHGANPEKPWDKPIHFIMIRGIRFYATSFAGCSKRAGTYLFGSSGIESSKWHYIPNTIQADRFRFNLSKRIINRDLVGISDSDVLYGAVGRLDTGKNHTFLIDVMSFLLRKGQNAKLILLGKGDQLDTLQRKSIDIGIEKHIIFYGETDDVPSWLSAMDYYLMPSLSEGFPISAVEAQANGLVCMFSTNISTEVDITDNVYHLPIDKGAEIWANALENLSPQKIEERKKGADIIRQKGFDEAGTQRQVRILYDYDESLG